MLVATFLGAAKKPLAGLASSRAALVLLGIVRLLRASRYPAAKRNVYAQRCAACSMASNVATGLLTYSTPKLANTFENPPSAFDQ